MNFVRIGGAGVMTASKVRARVVRMIDAPAIAVYDAWVVPSLMERWLFKSDRNRLVASADPRPGGTFSIVEHSDGKVITHEGRYSVTQRPRRLEFSLAVPQHFQGICHLAVAVSPTDQGSHLELVARGAGPLDAQKIWEWMLDNLSDTLGGERTNLHPAT